MSATTVNAVVPPPAPRRARSTGPRLCGLCRCPGHTRGKCPVIEVAPTYHFSEHGDVNVENNGQANAIIRNVRDKIRVARAAGVTQRLNLTYRDSYLRSKGLNPDNFRNFPHWKYSTPSPLVKLIVQHKMSVWRSLGHGQDPDGPMDAVWVLPEQYRQDTGLGAQQPLRPSDLTSQPTTTTPSAPPQVHAGGFTLEELEQTIHYNRGTAPPAPVQPEQELVVKDKVIADTTCPICMEDLTDCNRTVAACGHQFHTNCMINWVRQPRSTCTSCPTCRAPMCV